ncbi:MAG: acetylxylan esterase [Phycisphaerae bacterium]|nr:acetylxylan esterase [Phycisphaerae bacterium]
MAKRINSRVMPAFQTLADNTPAQLAWNAKTIEQHKAWQEKFHAKMIELLGRTPERVPLEVRWAGKKDFPKLTRHKVYVRTEANYWSPAYYFVPKQLRGRTPAVVCLHGHSGIFPYIREGTEAERKKCKEHSLDYAVYFAEHGYVTIAPVVRGWDETVADQDSGARNPRSCRRVTMDAFLMGMTPMGLRCWDAMRLVDFLQKQKEVDAERIGVAGLSGGGTLSLYLPVLDKRIKLAMIGGAFSSYRASIYSIGHCICNCLPHIMQYGDMEEVVASYAPLPVLLINGTKDPIFPIKEAKQGYAMLREVYELLGAGENVDADFFDGPHSWSNKKTLGFLAKHFGN